MSYLALFPLLLFILISVLSLYKKRKSLSRDEPPLSFHIYFFNTLLEIVEKFLPFRFFELELSQFPIVEPDEECPIFGPQHDTIKGLKAIIKGSQQVHTSPLGRLMLRNNLRGLLGAREQVMRYIRANPWIAEIKIRQPIIITGLPRTGSTFLQNLLQCDPGSRSPLHWEMDETSAPIPPPTQKQSKTVWRKNAENKGDDIHPVQRIAQENEAAFISLFPQVWDRFVAGHAYTYDVVEEELLILFHQMVNDYYNDPAGEIYQDWYFSEDNKEAAYRYLRRYLQLLSAGWMPSSHWLLKAPVHLHYFPTLMKTFPDARVVMTHRNPTKVLPSAWALVKNFVVYYFNGDEAPQSGKRLIAELQRAAEMTMSWRKQHPDISQKQIFDIDYETLVADPIGAVRRIYSFFSLSVSQEFVKNMENWLQNNPQHKRGKHRYSLNDIDTTEQQVQENFKDYIQSYLSK